MKSHMIREVKEQACRAVKNGLARFTVGQAIFFVEEIRCGLYAITLCGNSNSLLYVQKNGAALCATLV